MKSAVEMLRIFRRNPLLNFSPPSTAADLKAFSTTTTTSNHTSAAALSTKDLKQINAVIPRLCASSNHLKQAVLLLAAAMSTRDPPINSLPLSAVANRLALEPDLTLSMHLLNSLKHNPTTRRNAGIILPIAKMLVSSSFRAGRPRNAATVFEWVSRRDFGGGAGDDMEFYGVLVDGFCKNDMILYSIRVLRMMAREDLGIGDEIGMAVYRGLLREARVTQALGLRAALDSCTLPSDGGTFGSKQLVPLLDDIIANWAP